MLAVPGGGAGGEEAAATALEAKLLALKGNLDGGRPEPGTPEPPERGVPPDDDNGCLDCCCCCCGVAVPSTCPLEF